MSFSIKPLFVQPKEAEVRAALDHAEAVEEKPREAAGPAPLRPDVVVAEGFSVIENRYLSVRETAEVLQVTPMTVYRMLHDGRLRGTKTGRRYKVFAPDVAELNEPKDLSKGDSA